MVLVDGVFEIVMGLIILYMCFVVEIVYFMIDVKFEVILVVDSFRNVIRCEGIGYLLFWLY